MSIATNGNDKYSPEFIHAKKLDFVCYRDQIMILSAASMSCRAIGTDLTVTINAPMEYFDAAKNIIATSE
jgi:hypothetical protein